MAMPPGRYGRPRLAGDCGAIDGLPLTLMITMVILAISVPLIFGSLKSYDRNRVETTLASEIERFIASVQLIYSSGPGNSAVVDFAATPGSMTGIEYVIFGDEPGGAMGSVIRYKLQGSPETFKVIMSPNVPLMTPDGFQFTVQSGNHRIRAECRAGNEHPSDAIPGTHVVLEILH